MRVWVWCCCWTGVVLLLSTTTSPSEGLIFTGTTAAVSTGLLATLGLIGAVGIGVAIKKKLFRGNRYSSSYETHGGHHGYGGGGYGGGGYGGGDGYVCCDGGYGGGGAGGYGGGYGGAAYVGSVAPFSDSREGHFAKRSVQTWRGGRRSGEVKGKHSIRRRRAIRAAQVTGQAVGRQEKAPTEAMVEEDPLGCAQLLVCQLAATPSHLLQPHQRAVLDFATSGENPPETPLTTGGAGPGEKSDDGEQSSNNNNTSGVNRLAVAAAAGSKGSDCVLLYSKCPFSSQEVMDVISAVLQTPP